MDASGGVRERDDAVSVGQKGLDVVGNLHAEGADTCEFARILAEGRAARRLGGAYQCEAAVLDGQGGETAPHPARGAAYDYSLHRFLQCVHVPCIGRCTQYTHGGAVRPSEAQSSGARSDVRVA